MKTYLDFLNELAREHSCDSWKYYFEKNKRSERIIREFCEEAARQFAEQLAQIPNEELLANEELLSAASDLFRLSVRLINNGKRSDMDWERAMKNNEVLKKYSVFDEKFVLKPSN